MVSLWCVLVLWALLLMASSIEAVVSQNECLPGWLKAPSSGTCTQSSYYRTTWHAARAECQKKGGDLVTIRDNRMMKFLKKNIQWIGWDHYWYRYFIGLHDTETENTWRWLNETETATFTKWQRGEPNNWKFSWAKEGEDCVTIYKDKWYDALCSRRRRYMCERTPRSSAPGECKPGWFKNPSSGTCKQWYGEQKSWKDAKATCQQEGGDLATILDSATNKFVDDMRKSNDRGTCWIGLNDLGHEDKFLWPNENQEVHYTNWAPGNPGQTNRQGQDCVVVGYKESEKWTVFDCMAHSSFICETKGVCRFVGKPWQLEANDFFAKAMASAPLDGSKVSAHVLRCMNLGDIGKMPELCVRRMEETYSRFGTNA
ncbi:macrophage mannose receptor 1 [Plakobranchus ocellatus]|uniref:Macrophage mannose receptor 1 n=1 Tax=Plakobranchus ocellatus TaxID=259542 RepID=A0AAV4BD10_9GAST|nr:macrophage mannose receptor 1 [Plakobranchus ocellatus]